MTRANDWKLLIIIFLFVATNFAWGENIWLPLWLPTMTMIFDDVYFVEPYQGWGIGTSNSPWWSSQEDIGFIAHMDGDGWKLQFYDFGFQPESLQFLNATKGWVTGWRKTVDKKEGLLFSTEDGGKHWNERHRFPWALEQVHFVTERKGWAIGTGEALTGVILMTTDGGENWNLQYKKPNEEFREFSFADANNGWVFGWSREKAQIVLLHTTDGGEHWMHLPVGEKLKKRPITGIHFISPQEGWAVGVQVVPDDTGRDTTHWSVFHTQDSGQTWMEQKVGIQKDLVMLSPTICFVDAKEGWISGGILLHTTDGGNSWTIPIQGPMLLQADGYQWKSWPSGVHFLNAQHGWILGRGILSTTDGGTTWLPESQKPFGLRNMNEIIFVTPRMGWAVGQGGAIFHTDNGGVTWELQNSPTSAELFGAHFLTVQEGWVVSAEGAILHTTNGGHTWLEQRSGTRLPLKSVQFLNPQEGWAVGGQEGIILHTLNGGRNWKPVKNVRVDLWFHDVHFVNPQIGWMVGFRSILHTEDGGRTWEEQECEGMLRPRAIHFVDASTGWVVFEMNSSFSIDSPDARLSQPVPVQTGESGGICVNLRH